MFFDGNLAVDPSQLTKIKTVAPDGFFRKMLFVMTGGRLSGDKREQQTFTVLSVLQQFKAIFKDAGIDNVVRLTQDDIDFYFDTEGKKNDLEEALEAYDLEVNESFSSEFKTLHLVLEHNKGSFHYLIDIRINRTHEVGKYPIEIKLSGLLNEFKAELDDGEAVKAEMQEIFRSQATYDAFKNEKQAEFDRFLQMLSQHIRKFVQVDDLKVESTTKIIVPKNKPKRVRDSVPNPSAPTTVFHGYHGFGDMLFYSMMWGSMCHDNHIHVHDTDLVSDSGEMIGSIGSEGFDAGDSSLFDTDVDFDDRLSDSTSNLDDFSTEDSDFFDGDASDIGDIGDSDGGGWFDDFDGGGFDFDGFDF